MSQVRSNYPRRNKKKKQCSCIVRQNWVMKDVYLGKMTGKRTAGVKKASKEMGYSGHKEKMHLHSCRAVFPQYFIARFHIDFPGLLMLIF